jgi:nitrous oxidase accessory protein
MVRLSQLRRAARVSKRTAKGLPCLWVVFLYTLAAPAAERRVSPGELQATLVQARPGDTIRLSAGIHPGPITITKPVRLIGEPGAIIEGNGQGSVLILSSDSIRVSNLKVRGSGADLSQDDAVILLYEVRNVVVEYSEVEARAFGIYIRGGGNNRVIGNVVRGDPSLSRSRRGNGIHLWRTRHNEILNNRVESVRDGLYFSFAHDNRIQDNEGSQLRYGIHYMYSERNTLFGNRFSECIGGMALMFSRGNRVEENTVARNRDFGILGLFLERSIVRLNQVSENGRGMFVEDSHSNRFSANHVQRNGVGAYVTAGSEANVFAENRFEGNLVQVYHTHAAANAWSEAGRGNFWGDYSGFDWNGDGIGDTPYYLQTTASALMARYPVARWFWMTPLVALLDWWDSLLAKSASSLFDPAPLIRPVEQTEPLADSSLGRL